ncbi:hypothetical protein GCM10009741_76060 [Kribbella lupini]|uniref:Alanine dehydrogenase/pyridine nucleotide transhydrogenase N-terminal domain-containing protein n=1 Tax=Kribbella lupini TaxID=291602 RepID=A0ABN2CJF4_9ACTN
MDEEVVGPADKVRGPPVDCQVREQLFVHRVEQRARKNRVAITLAGVDILVVRGDEVLVQQGAGVGSRIDDQAYADAGATIVGSAEEVWGASELITKVKEPIAPSTGSCATTRCCSPTCCRERYGARRGRHGDRPVLASPA